MAFRATMLFALLLLDQYAATIGNHAATGFSSTNDEKCFKIIDDTLRTFDEAKDVCASQEQPSTLPVIRSSEEQHFLTNYLFKTEQKADNFWIGAKYNTSLQNDSLVWIDNSALRFTNWDAGHGGPQSGANHCVQMQADERVAGKWKDGRCDKKNAVLCQRIQFWSNELPQKAFIDSRKQQSDTIRNLTQSLASANQRIAKCLENVDHRFNELKQNLDNANGRINELQNQLVPAGFIYVQLPHQPEPRTLWPTVQWQDVTPQYSGLFFRAEGTNATAFGSVQEENAPRVTQVKHAHFSTNQLGAWMSTNLNPGGWSSGIGVFAGSWNHRNGYTHQFHQTGGEVRPRKMAMRFWKRI